MLIEGTNAVLVVQVAISAANASKALHVESFMAVLYSFDVIARLPGGQSLSFWTSRGCQLKQARSKDSSGCGGGCSVDRKTSIFDLLGAAKDDSHEILLPFTWCSVFLSHISLENTIVAMRGRENGYHIVKQQANSRQRAFPRQKNLLDTDFCSGSDSLASSIKLDFSYIARTHGWMFQ